MSGFDYERLALDHHGEPIDAFTTPGGVSAEIYKTWVYIRDPKAWRPGRFVAPTIAEFWHGSACYQDLYVFASRMPSKNGIFCAAWSGHGKSLTGMVGIGVYAWRNAAHVALRKMGREIKPGEPWEAAYGPAGDESFELHRMGDDYQTLEVIAAEEPSREELWAGIEPADLEGLREFLRGDDVPHELGRVRIP